MGLLGGRHVFGMPHHIFITKSTNFAFVRHVVYPACRAQGLFAPRCLKKRKEWEREREKRCWYLNPVHVSSTTTTPLGLYITRPEIGPRKGGGARGKVVPFTTKSCSVIAVQLLLPLHPLGRVTNCR